MDAAQCVSYFRNQGSELSGSLLNLPLQVSTAGTIDLLSDCDMLQSLPWQADANLFVHSGVPFGAVSAYVLVDHPDAGRLPCAAQSASSSRWLRWQEWPGQAPETV